MSPVDGLTSGDDDVRVHFGCGAGQSVGSGQRIRSGEFAVGQQYAAVGSAEHAFADNFRRPSGAHRQDVDAAAGKHVLQDEGLFERVEVFRVENGRQGCAIHRSVGFHGVFADVAGVGNLFGQNNYFQRFFHC